MRIIPVLDISEGMVVHARLGQRENYRILQSPLCSSGRPLDVIRALLDLHPFDTIYIADLDALSGKDPQVDILMSLLSTWPHIEFWLDSGARAIPGISGPGNCKRVLGTETNCGLDEIKKLVETEHIILSMDFLDNQHMGQAEIMEQPVLWPRNVIIMSLDRVGSGLGPDIDRIASFQQRDSSKSYYAAGGVRGYQDLCLLSKKGVRGALVASCLHNGNLTAEHLQQL